MRLICAGLLAASLCLGQEFEVVSIKPNNSGSGSSRSSSNQTMLRGTNLSLQNLIVTAYGIRSYQLYEAISFQSRSRKIGNCCTTTRKRYGPDWLESQRFDVVAKFSEPLPKDRELARAAYQTMLQKMLAERFKIAVHHDQKTMGVFALEVGKGGIKCKEVPPGQSKSNSHNTHYTGEAVTMDVFATFLSGQMDMPVIDMTGLKASYDSVPRRSTGSPNSGARQSQARLLNR